jgi:SEC-C motif-containing protein
MNEISRFTKINGHWFYLDGVIKSIGKVGMQTNQGKNAQCSCGSGKKFKRCCGAGWGVIKSAVFLEDYHQFLSFTYA